MDNEDFDLEERAYIQARDSVSDDEFVVRINPAPDMGGALLVELHNFASRRGLFGHVIPLRTELP